MAQAKQGDSVKIHYTGTLDDGTVFDSSVEREPLEFQLGAGQVIPGFEKAVMGMNLGDKKTTTIPSDEAYGARREDLFMEIDHDQFPPTMKPTVGDQLQIRQPDGQSAIVTVAEISDSGVVLDANHPLAGQDLTFEIELVEIG